MRYIFLLLFGLGILSCANQGNLTGGEKDETPPRLVYSIPENETTNFNSTRFELFFDENIKVANLKENLLVSPFLAEKPIVKIKSRSIMVEIQEELLPNTTYTFNFGNAIADLNEGNELAGFAYVFSTGETLDSLTLTGNALFAQTGEIPEEGAWALLYNSSEDSLFKTSAPNYVAPILEDGSFSFKNLKEGDYKMYALRDNNLNYFFDLPNEEIGFVDSLIQVGQQTQISEPIRIFMEEPTSGFVKKMENDQVQSIKFETSTSTQRFDIQLFPKILIAFQSGNNDSIRMWFEPSQPLPDSATVYFDGKLVDTLNYTQKVRELKDSVFKVRAKNTSPYSPYKPIYIHASRPFDRNVEIKEPVLLEDSLFVAGGVQFIRDSLDARRLLLDYDWSLGKTYILEFDDSSFVDILGLPSDSLQIAFSTPKKEALSTLNIQFITNKYKEEPLLFQLLSKGQVFFEKQVSQGETLTLKDLPKGKYTTKVIVDSNGNGKWDAGVFDSKTQPEIVLNFETEIELRPNWELDVGIDLDQ